MWYIVVAVVAFLCGGSVVMHALQGMRQLNEWDIGRLERVRQSVVGRDVTLLRKEAILKIINKEINP